MTNTPSYARDFLIPADLGNGAVRVIDRDGEPWFVAADIGAALDLAHVASSLRSLDDEEKGVHTMHTLGGSQEMTIVSESGLYALILQSRKPSAKAFRKWVTGTVLPTLRKTGSYVVGEEKLDPTTDAGFLALQKLYTETLAAKLKAVEAKYEAARPKAEAFEVIETASGSMTVTDASKALKAKRVNLYAWMTGNGWVTHKQPRQATRYAIARGYMETNTLVDRQGHVRHTPVVTAKGLAYLARNKAEREAAKKAA